MDKSQKIIRDSGDVAFIYTPALLNPGQPVMAVPADYFDLTVKDGTVAIVSDGSAVPGLGALGPQAMLSVLETRARQFREFAQVDAFPVFVGTQDEDKFTDALKHILPLFSGVHLEDIRLEKSYSIERVVEGLRVPVYFDHIDGLAISILAGLFNAACLAGKNVKDLTVVINGAGIMAHVLVDLLLAMDFGDARCLPCREILVCDRGGILARSREDIAEDRPRNRLAGITNKNDRQGHLRDALTGADAYIGWGDGQDMTDTMILLMNRKPVIFALRTPAPDIDPRAARKSGAFIVATLRREFPNQLRPELVSPGMFRGVLDAHARIISNKMKIAAAQALASSVEGLSADNIFPVDFDEQSAKHIAGQVTLAFSRN